MKKEIRILLLGLASFLYMPSLKVQDDISELFKGGVADLQTIADGYIKPLGTGFSTGLGNNWYNTGAVHKACGFDITIGANALFVPSSDKSFSLEGLKNIQPLNGETSSPSFAGGGLGFIKSKFGFNFIGNIPILGDINPATGKIKVENLIGPVLFSYSNSKPGRDCRVWNKFQVDILKPIV